MYFLTAKADFDSAHFLLGHKGKCSNIHGHRWELLAKIGSETLIEEGPSNGMVIDFSNFKKVLRGLAEEFDHKLIIEKSSLKAETVAMLESENFSIVTLDFRPTAENLAKYFFDKIKENGLPIISMTVYETPDNCAIYEEV